MNQMISQCSHTLAMFWRRGEGEKGKDRGRGREVGRGVEGEEQSQLALTFSNFAQFLESPTQLVDVSLISS